MQKRTQMKRRSITAEFEVSQDRPSPYLPVKFEETNFIPYDTPQEYAEYLQQAINSGKPVEVVHEYDEVYKMPGKYTAVEVIDGRVWVTFTPEKLANCWVSFGRMP